jgi:Flp pilus assembly protein TadD
MRTRALPSGRVRVAAGAPIVAVIACAFAGPWLSGLEEESAGRVWVQNSAVAYRRLEDAASLDPLSGDPYMLAASIALRNSELGRARRDFELALGRSSENEYATLELGAIASAQGELPRASRLLTRAQVLYPRGVLAREGLQLTREGTRISTTSLDQLILQEAQALQ